MKEYCKHCGKEIHFDNIGYHHPPDGKGDWYHNHNSNGYCSVSEAREDRLAEPKEEIKYIDNNFMEMLKAL